MRDAEEFPGKPWLGRKPKGAGHIRYANGPRAPHAAPFCTVTQELGGSAAVAADTGALGLPWSAEFPVAGRRNDLWVLVSGGIAAAAAFAAAFMASGGVASHPTPLAPAAVSQACPAPVSGASP